MGSNNTGIIQFNTVQSNIQLKLITPVNSQTEIWHAFNYVFYWLVEHSSNQLVPSWNINDNSTGINWNFNLGVIGELLML